mgnify:CR=1 FL=1
MDSFDLFCRRGDAEKLRKRSGKNSLRMSLEDPSANGYGINPKKYGKVTALEIFLYTPHAGETVEIGPLRLLREKTAVPPRTEKFKVAGTSLETPSLRDLAKTIIKAIKDSKQKVQAAIQGDELRVTGKKIDDLQATIAVVRGLKIEQPLQYLNFRD